MHVALRRAAGRTAALALSLAFLACSDSLISPNGGGIRPGDAARVISLPGGTLTWLAPLGNGRANPATFDSAGANRVEICEWERKKCDGSPVASFTLANKKLKANTVKGQFEATWDVSRIKSGNKEYRIAVFRDTTLVGSIIVDKDDLDGKDKDKDKDSYGGGSRHNSSNSRGASLGGGSDRGRDDDRRNDGRSDGRGNDDHDRGHGDKGKGHDDRDKDHGGRGDDHGGRGNGHDDHNGPKKDDELEIRFHIAVIPVAKIIFNEIESNGGTPDDWFELYNAGTTTVDLGGFVFKDGDDTHNFTIPAGTTIAPGAYVVFDNAVDPAKPSAPIFDFGLGAPESVRLWDQYGRLLDSTSWTAHSATTYGRCPNVTGAIVPTTSPTKGTENDCSVPVKINEVESNQDQTDWIELYNPSGLAIDISGFVLKDNDTTHSFVIPAGTTIPSHGFLAFDVDAAFGLGGADDARLYDTSGKLLDSFTWATHAATTYGRCPDGTGGFVTTARGTKGAANDCSSPIPVRINEVESDGDATDWIELYNTGTEAVDLSNYVLKDNDDTHAWVIPAGTTIPSHGVLAFDVSVGTGNFGLGGADQARLFTPNSAALVDVFDWSAHAAVTTYGRCPDGTGAFVTTVASTKGQLNACPAPPPVAAAWPGGADIVTVDALNQFSSNLSGLVYEVGDGSTPDVLWAALNGPGSIFRLIFDTDAQAWLPDASNGWAAGKRVHYVNGTGEPDAEDLTYTTGSNAGMYVATERDNQNNGVSHPAILRFDVTGTSTEISATNEWDLTASLPVLGANLGIEAITWIPDAFLTSHNFFDASKGHAYNPAEYANHGGGLFFIGIEGNGMIYVYALDHVTNGFTQIASVSTGFPAGVMALQFDRELGYLWATCDDTCGGLSEIFEIDQTPGGNLGKLKITHIFNRPTNMPNINNEGFAFTSNARCDGGFKPVFWSDDSNTGGHSIRRGSIPCIAFP